MRMSGECDGAFRRARTLALRSRAPSLSLRLSSSGSRRGSSSSIVLCGSFAERVFASSRTPSGGCRSITRHASSQVSANAIGDKGLREVD